MAMTSRFGTVKACWGADLRQFQEARLCAPWTGHKDGQTVQQSIDHVTSWVTHPA